MAKNNTPLEDDECKAFVKWMELQGLMFNHIKNENPIRRPGMYMKLKAMGVRKGFPDYVVLVSEDKSSTGNALLFFIEMKRQKGSSTSSEQKEWIRELDKVKNTGCKICKGADEAIEFISKYIKSKKKS